MRIIGSNTARRGYRRAASAELKPRPTAEDYLHDMAQALESLEGILCDMRDTLDRIDDRQHERT